MDQKNNIVALFSVCVIAIFLGKQVYNHYYSKEEQAKRAAIKLQKAFEEKMQEELIKSAEALEQNQCKQSMKTNTLKQEEKAAPNTEVIENNQNRNSDQTDFLSRDSLHSERENAENSEAVTICSVTIGKTTENDIRNRFSVVEERKDLPESATYKLLFLGPKGFSFIGLSIEESFVVINKQGVVEQLNIVFSGPYFDKLHSALSQKYKVTHKEVPFVGDKIASYTKDNILIDLKQPHMGGFRTYLSYCTKDLVDVCRAYRKKQNEQKKQRLLNQL